LKHLRVSRLFLSGADALPSLVQLSARLASKGITGLFSSSRCLIFKVLSRRQFLMNFSKHRCLKLFTVQGFFPCRSRRLYYNTKYRYLCQHFFAKKMAKTFLFFDSEEYWAFLTISCDSRAEKPYLSPSFWKNQCIDIELWRKIVLIKIM
ncbi:MAG: hypothetical protein ACLUFA_00305, partial [[Clostridium] leptum]